MNVAVPVASATGKNVRELTSGHHQLDSEQDAADRRIESGGDTAPRTRGNKNDLLPRRHSHYLAQGRSESRPDLDDRILATDSRTTADRDRRSQRLHDSDNGPDHAAAIIDRVHNLGHAVAPGLGGKGVDEEGHCHATQHRNQNDERPPWARGREQVGVVPKCPPAEK